MDLSKLPTDVLITMAHDLDIPQLLSLCKTNKELNRKVCKNQNFWRQKLIQEYGLTPAKPLPRNLSAKKVYSILYKNRGVPNIAAVIRQGDINAVKVALLFTDVNSYIHNPLGIGHTPLTLASQVGFSDVVDVLLTAGADPNLPNKRRDTPLFTAVSNAN